MGGVGWWLGPIFACLLSNVVQGVVTLGKIDEKTLFEAVKSRSVQNLASLRDPGGKFSAFVVASSVKYGQQVEQFRAQAPECLASLGALPNFQLSDGSLRRTFASIQSYDFPGCLNSTAQALSQHFSYVEDLITQVAQIISGKDLTYELPETHEIVELTNSPHKDHIHVYEYHNDTAHSDAMEEYMVPYHVDNGLFLLITPFPGHGLQLQLSDGSVAQTDDLESSDILVFFGLGMTHWLLQGDPKAKELFFPTPHAVPSMAFGSINSRTVYARMKTAPAMATPVSDHAHHLATFQEIFMQKGVPGESHDSKVCSVTLNEAQTEEERRRDPWLKAMDTLCAEGDAFCWMGCYPLPEACPSPDQATCFSHVTNVTCSTEKGGKPMDPTCEWECLPKSTARVQPNEYCNGRMGMLMFGFDFSGNKNNPCIVLFIEAWTLDTPWKFGVALVGVMAMGFSIEALMALRRRLLKRRPPFHRLRPLHRKAVVILIFGIKLILGYLAMLVAMTYSFELFLFVIIGFVIGHAVFNINSDLGESIDPCCSSACDTKTGTPLIIHSGSIHEETNCLVSPSNSGQPILDNHV